MKAGNIMIFLLCIGLAVSAGLTAYTMRQLKAAQKELQRFKVVPGPFWLDCGNGSTISCGKYDKASLVFDLGSLPAPPLPDSKTRGGDK